MILAQTVNTCTATRYAAPALRVRTAITRADSLAQGKSYYLAEAEVILDMLAVRGSGQFLFLLDELFRGTNTTERIAAGAAVLECLVQSGDMAVVATHDEELLGFIAGAYSPWHFSESVTQRGLEFDYILRPGPATARNAIALLATLGAPDQVVARATEICNRLDALAIAPH